MKLYRKLYIRRGNNRWTFTIQKFCSAKFQNFAKQKPTSMALGVGYGARVFAVQKKEILLKSLRSDGRSAIFLSRIYSRRSNGQGYRLAAIVLSAYSKNLILVDS